MSRSSRLHTHDVSERRLRPVYEALDDRKFKKVIQLADKLIKKDQDASAAKVLKALAKIRSGHEKEGYDIVDEIMKKLPQILYEPLLQALSLFYRESHKFERISEVFEAAVAKEPKNETYLSHLFMAYIRIGQYKKQQETARNLYKLFSKNIYYYWTVTSIVMQAYSCEDQRLAKTMYLPLAQKMIEKQMKSGQVESDPEVKLYVSVLDMQEKYEDALLVLRGALGGTLKNRQEKELKELLFVRKLKRWPELNRLAKVRLEKSPDDWTAWLHFIESVIVIIKIEDSDQANEDSPDTKHWDLAGADSTLEKAHKFIKAKIDAEGAKRSQANRGPYLAPFELMKQAVEKEIQSSRFALDSISIVDLFLMYFDQFGDCRSCHSDVDPYLCLLLEEEKEELISRVKSSVVAMETKNYEKEDLSVNDALKVMQRHIFSIQLARSLGNHDKLTVSGKLELVKEMKQRLEDGKKYRSAFLETDVCPVDTYAQIAVHILVNLHEETHEYSHIWESIWLLENVVREKNTNAQLKLLLVKLYSYVGAFAPCIEIYSDLDIRSIQVDSLGYLFVPVGISLGYFAWAKTIVEPILLFFLSQVKSCPEYIISAYHDGTYNKIIEMTKFQQRMKQSLRFALGIYENATFEFLSESSSIHWARSLFYSLNLQPFTPELEANLSDNRDLFVMDSWDPSHRRMTKEKAKASTQIEIRWLNLRSTLFYTMWIATEIVDTVYSANPPPLSTSFSLEEEFKKMEKAFSEFREAFVRARETPELETKFPFLQGPPPSPIHHFLQCGYMEMMECLVPLLQQIILAADKKWPQEKADECIRLTAGLPKLTERLQRQRETAIHVYSTQIRLGNGAAISQVIQLAETLVHATLYVCMCNKVVTANKTKKRSKVTRMAEPMIKALQEFQSKLMEEIDKLKSDLFQVKQDATKGYEENPQRDSMDFDDVRHHLEMTEREDKDIEIDCTSVEGVEKSVRECCVSKLHKIVLAMTTKLVLSVKTMKW